MPAELESKLWIWCHHQRLRNARMESELATLLDILAAEAVPVVPHKGPVLARRLYRDVALRAFSDLDLLVPVDRVLHIKSVLAEHGFEPLFPLSPALEAAFLRSPVQYHWMLRHHRNGLLVELHWRTDSEFAVEPPDDPAWWHSLPKRDWGGRQVLCLPDSELLLGLCLHGSKHHWESLHWLVDVAELIRQSGILDWPWILARTESLRGERRLGLALQLLVRAFDLTLPSEVESWARRDPVTTELADEIMASWFSVSQPSPGALARLGFNVRLYTSVGQRLRHITSMILRPSLVEWSRWPLPRAAFFLYPPIRLGRLFLRRVLGRS